MRKFTIYVIMVVTFLLSSQVIYAQNQDPSIWDVVDNALSELDMSEITTNTLVDKSINVIDLSKLHGTQNSSNLILDGDDFTKLAYQINRSLLDPTLNSIDISTLESKYTSQGNGVIELGIMNWSYHQAIEDPVGNNLLGFNSTTQMFYDVPNRPSSPYVLNHFVALGALVDTELLDNSQAFRFSSEAYYTNGDLPVSLEANFDDGNGFQILGFDTDYSVIYSGEGEKIIEVKITMSSGVEYYASTKISLGISLESNNSKNPTEISTLRTSGSSSYDFTYTSVGGTADAFTAIVPGFLVSIAYNCFDAEGKGVLTKPFIIVEGIDPPSIDNINTFESWENRLCFNSALAQLNSSAGSPFTIPTGGTFLDALYDEGYDIVYIDYLNFGDADIFDNGDRVRTVVETINEMKEVNGSSEQNVIFGTSMGGIVAYRALQMMEKAGVDPECEYFFSWDSPFRGAVVPESLQHLAIEVGNIEINGEKLVESLPDLERPREFLGSMGARQLLITNLYHSVDADGDTEHDNYIQELFGNPPPASVKHIAISNGSGIGEGQFLSPGDRYAKIKANLDLIGILTFDINFDLWMEDEINSLLYFQNISFWVFNIRFNNKKFGYQKSPYSYTTAPGSTQDFDLPIYVNQINDLIEGLNLPSIIDLEVDFPSNGEFGFAPTFSPLLVSGVTNPTTFIPSSNCVSPIHSCISSLDASIISKATGVGSSNQFHVSFNSIVATYMLNFLQSGGNGADIHPLDNEIYNYGESNEPPNVDPTVVGFFKTDNIIDFDLDILNEGQLWVNREGRIDFTSIVTNPQNNQPDHFDLFIGGDPCDGDETIVRVHSNSKFKIGHWHPNVNNTADVHVKENAVLILENRSELNIDENSKLIIDGGKVIIKDGGLLQSGWHTKIIIQNEGELIVESGGQLRLRNNAQLVVEEDGKFTFKENSKFQLWTDLIAEDHPNRCNIFVKRKGIFNYGGRPRVTGKGFIQFNEHNLITTESGVSEFRFFGVGKDDMLFQLNKGADMNIVDVNVRLQNLKVEYEQSSQITVDERKRIWIFGSRFVGRSNVQSIGIVGLSRNSIFILDSEFENLWTGLLTFENDSRSLYDIRNTDFLNNKTGLWSFKDDVINLIDCQFIGEGQNSRGLRLEGTGVTNFYSNSIVTGYGGDPFEYINNFEEAGIVALIYEGRVPTIRLDNSSIFGNGIGIFSPERHKCSVGVFNDSGIDDNDYGISMPDTPSPDGQTSSSGNSGVVTVDCSSISRNKYAGVHGSYIHLIIDASQPHIGSNTFLRHPNGDGVLFDLWKTDPSYCSLGIAAFGNYWGPNDYCPTYGTDYFIKGTNLCWIYLQTSCPEIISCDSDDPLPPCDTNPERSCPCELPPTDPDFENMNQQWNAGVLAYKNGDLELMESLFTPLASISNADRLINGGDCAQLVDHARALAPYTIVDDDLAPNPNDREGNTRSDNSATKILEENIKVYPNPTSDIVNIDLDERYLVKVNSTNGKMIYQGIASENLSISTKEWSTGVYIISLENIETKRKIYKRIIRN